MVNKLDLAGIGMTSQRTRSRLVSRLRAQGIKDELVLDIINSTPRHVFIDEALSHRAYEDNALPIGFNQTISQPYIVARMTACLLAAGPLKNVLEIGTGCGYQTAVLAQLVDNVSSVERIRGLHERAKETLRKLGLRNIRFKYDDGNIGWQARGPFDGIIVTASPAQVPAGPIEQLAPGGRLICPVGGEDQELHLLVNTADGIETEVLERVKFVPLVNGRI